MKTTQQKSIRGWIKRLSALHAGRSWLRLSIYLIILLILTPISIVFELLRDLCDSISEFVNRLSTPLQKWAYFRKLHEN